MLADATDEQQLHDCREALEIYNCFQKNKKKMRERRHAVGRGGTAEEIGRDQR
jgi:hypothetical protein